MNYLFGSKKFKKRYLILLLLCSTITNYVLAAQQPLNAVPKSTASNAITVVRDGVNTELAKQQGMNTELYAADLLKANISCFANAVAFNTCFTLDWQSVDASGFNGNLTTTDDTLQEIAQKVDDLVLGSGSGVDAFGDIVALWASGSCTGYLYSDGTCSTPPGSVPTGTEGQTIQYGSGGTPAAVDLVPLAFTDNVSRNSTTGVVSVPVTATATSGSAVPFTSGGAYTALGGKQDTLISGTSIKTINSTSLLGSGNIDIAGGTGVYVSLSAAPYSDVACTTGTYGYYESTAYLCTGGFWTSKWTLTTHSNAAPVTYTLAIDGTGWNGTDLVSVGGSTYTADGTKTGLSGSTSVTVIPDTGREATCSGTGITGSTSQYSADMSTNRTIACTFSDIVAASFVGAPGSVEGFEEPGISLSEFFETDTENYINCSSSTASHSLAYSCEFANAAAVSTTNYIKADIGVAEESYTLSWWWKTPNNANPTYSNGVIWVASASTLVSSADRNGEISWDGQGSNGKLIFSQISTTNQDTQTSTLAYNTWYKFVVRATNNGASHLDIYNSSLTLVETLDTTFINKPVRYFYWTDTIGVVETTYLDDIQYDSTNP